MCIKNNMENSTDATLELLNRIWKRTDNILIGFSMLTYNSLC